MEQYQRLKLLGRGSFGKVYLMKRRCDENLICMKVIEVNKMKKQQQDLCQVEIEVLKKLHHPNIVGYHDSFISSKNGYLCIVMEYCDGGDLDQLLKAAKDKLFSERKILSYFVQMALGLHHMHSNRVLHRDLKTQNVFLLRNGRIVLGDLGISKVLDNGNDFTSTCIGTPYYMSPEIFKNKPYNQKSDVWALGCVLYELTTLRHAFDASSLSELCYKITRGSFHPIDRKYSFSLRNLIASMLSTSAQSRPDMFQVISMDFVTKHVRDFFLDFGSRREKAGNSTANIKQLSANMMCGELEPDFDPIDEGNLQMRALKQQMKDLNLNKLFADASPLEFQRKSALKREKDRQYAVEQALARLRKERREKNEKKLLSEIGNAVSFHAASNGNNSRRHQSRCSVIHPDKQQQSRHKAQESNVQKVRKWRDELDSNKSNHSIPKTSDAEEKSRDDDSLLGFVLRPSIAWSNGKTRSSEKCLQGNQRKHSYVASPLESETSTKEKQVKRVINREKLFRARKEATPCVAQNEESTPKGRHVSMSGSSSAAEINCKKKDCLDKDEWLNRLNKPLSNYRSSAETKNSVLKRSQSFSNVIESSNQFFEVGNSMSGRNVDRVELKAGEESEPASLSDSAEEENGIREMRLVKELEKSVERCNHLKQKIQQIRNSRKQCASDNQPEDVSDSSTDASDCQATGPESKYAKNPLKGIRVREKLEHPIIDVVAARRDFESNESGCTYIDTVVNKGTQSAEQFMLENLCFVGKLVDRESLLQSAIVGRFGAEAMERGIAYLNECIVSKGECIDDVSNDLRTRMKAALGDGVVEYVRHFVQILLIREMMNTDTDDS